MSSYEREIERISNARSFDAIRDIVREFESAATREGGVLYSGSVGEERAEKVALRVASERGLPIINDTPRAIFLSDERVIEAIDSRVREILIDGGMAGEDARAVAANFRYGDPSLPRIAELSVERSLWGEASREFAGSLRGDVEVVATQARADRVMGRVEIPEIIESGRVSRLGGVPLDEVSRLHAQGGADAVLDRVQAPMRALVDAGLPPPRTGIGSRALGAAATGIGVALTVAEGNEAIQRSGVLYDMGNETGARSELIHFGSRSVGAWGGAALGAGVGAAGTSWSGPGAIIGGIVGGAAGLVGGQYVADVLDHRSIYRQQDAQGYTYAFDPENPALGWRRTETIDQIAANGRIVEQSREVVASGVLASQLDRQATTVSLELMLARPPVPRDPYSLPAGPGDASSARESPWQRDPATGEWQRQMYDLQATPRGPVPAPAGVITADPSRAAQLDAESQAILRENVHLAPAAMAARYELAYHDRGWRQHGELPESARNALADDGRLVASDGAEYQRQSDGRWERQAYFRLTTADANPTIAAELNATRAYLQEGLREHREMMVERPLPAPPTFEESMTGTVERAYARQNLQPSAEVIDTMGRAMAADYRARGMNEPFMLQLERDPLTNQYGPDSPMGLYTRGADGDMALRFTMTPAEARELLAAPPSRGVSTPSPATPDVASTPPLSPAMPPRAAASPSDPLNESMRAFVHAMDRSLGRTPDQASDRVAAALCAECRANGINRVDGVVLGQKGTSAQPGEYVFAYSGSLERPNDWVGVKTAEAVRTPVDESLAKAETLQREQALDAQRIALAQQQSSEASVRSIG